MTVDDAVIEVEDAMGWARVDRDLTIAVTELQRLIEAGEDSTAAREGVDALVAQATDLREGKAA